jgi:ketosteroid isomerase-like protein
MNAIVRLCAALAVLTLVCSVALATAGADPSGSAPAQAKDRSRCSTAIEERNLALFNERLEKLTSGDVPSDADYFDPDATVVVHGSVPYAGTYTNANGAYTEALLRYWNFPTAGGSTPTLYADCDKVILIGPFNPTAKETGKALDTTVIEFFTYTRAGKIIRDDFYFTDTVAVNAALSP